MAGVCDLVGSVGPLTLEAAANAARSGFVAKKLPYARTFAWVLANPVRLATPVSFVPKPGAVIWLGLAPTVAAAVEAQL